MLNRENMHEYQNHSVQHIIDNPKAGLFLEMGLGKTVSTLTAIDYLMFDSFEVSSVLVIAPKRVVEDTWPSEVQNWAHLRHLKVSVVLGTEKARKAALRAKADIYCINRENVAWLIAYFKGHFPFDMLVIDELSSFKSNKSIRFKALRTVRPYIKRVLGLTGTPATNGLIDLWAQMYLLDQGERLGTTIGAYRDRYFVPGKRNGHIIYDYKLRKPDGSIPEDTFEKEIFNKIGDICISMKSADWLDLPGRIDRDIIVRLDADTQKRYDDFEKELVMSLPEGEQISVANASALSMKLRQFANGAVYGEDEDGNRIVHELHDAKIEALEEIIEAANGKPLLVFYAFTHDADRILDKLKKYKPKLLGKGSEDIKSWNLGEIPVLLAHPMSAGHGLNMQAGGNLVAWFGLPWSADQYLQSNARLDRQGQKEVVINQRIIVKGSIDEKIVLSLKSNISSQDALMDAVKAIIEKHKK